MLILNLFPFALLSFINIYVLYQLMVLFFDLNDHHISLHEALRYTIYYIGAFSLLFIFDAPILYLLWVFLLVGWIAQHYTLHFSQALPVMLTYFTILLFIEIIPIFICVQSGVISGTTIFDANIVGVYFFQKIGLLLALLLVQSYLSKKRDWVQRPFFAYLLLFLIIGLHMLALGIHVQLPFFSRLSPFNDFGLSILLILSLLLCLFLFKRTHELYQQNMIMILQDQERKMYQRQLKYYESHQVHLKSLEHDVNKHFAMMQSYLNEGNVDALQAYIGGYLKNFSFVQDKVSTGHIIIDVLMNDAIQRAKDANIDLRTTFYIQEEIYIQEHDLTTILANLIENAIKAVSALPLDKRWISIKIVADKGQLLIETKNPYKDNGATHFKKGLGIKNIEMVAEKYKGQVDILTNDGLFSFRILIYPFV